MVERDDISEERVSNRYVALLAITLCQAVCLLDRNILPMLAEPIKAELGISDTEVGLLTGLTFALFYCTCGLPLAGIADRTGRVRLIAVAAVFWSVFTALCAAAANFWQLAAARVGVAVGESGCTPSSYSLIADYFPFNQRATAIAIFCLGAPIGTMAGAAIAGFVGSAYGWRAALVVASLPGLAIAAFFWFCVHEPRPGRLDGNAGVAVPPVGIMAAIKAYVRTPALRRITIAGACANFVGYGTMSWMPPFLMRTQGMSLSNLGVYYSVVTGLSMVVGFCLSGYLSDRLARRNTRAYGRIPAIAFLIGLPFFVAAVCVSHWSTSLLLLIVPGIATSMFGAPAGAVVQNATPPGQRSTASAIYVFVAVVAGLGFGPLFVGFVSDHAGAGNAAEGLRIGLLALAPFYALAAALYYWASRALDRETVAAKRLGQPQSRVDVVGTPSSA